MKMLIKFSLYFYHRYHMIIIIAMEKRVFEMTYKLSRMDIVKSREKRL